MISFARHFVRRCSLGMQEACRSPLHLRIWRALNARGEPATVPWRQRLVVALLIGVVATFFAHHQLTGRHWLASDFEYDLRAAKRLLAGLNPYTDPSSHFGLPYPYDAQFPYPLFAAILAVPFTLFSSYIAGALFVGCLSAIMAFAVTRRDWWRLCIFLSPSYFVAASVANWSPLLVAAAFLPLLYPLAIVKPTMIAPVMLTYPNLRGFVLCVPVFVFSLIVMPSWPHFWLMSLSHQHGKYLPPLVAAPVLLVLVAAWWWRKRSARLLILLACIPQHPFFYDQLLLWLIPKTMRQSLAFSAVGWASYFLWFSCDPDGNPWLARTIHVPDIWWTAPHLYLPALVLVVWQQYVARRAGRIVAEQNTSSTATPALVAGSA